MYDTLTKMIEFEQDGLPEDELIELFQHLVDNGMAWSLQGFYGRIAVALIESGDVITSRSQRDTE